MGAGAPLELAGVAVGLRDRAHFGRAPGPIATSVVLGSSAAAAAFSPERRHLIELVLFRLEGVDDAIAHLHDRHTAHAIDRDELDALELRGGGHWIPCHSKMVAPR